MAIFAWLRTWRETRTGMDSLARVVRIEIEVLRSYDRAIGKVNHPGTADQLAQFRNEHAQHLVDLFAFRRLARMFPRGLRDAGRGKHHGYEGKIAFAADTEGALREVLAVEEVAWRGWASLSGVLPAGLSRLVARIREDERRHLRFLRNLIETRVWDLEESVPETP